MKLWKIVGLQLAQSVSLLLVIIFALAESTTTTQAVIAAIAWYMAYFLAGWIVCRNADITMWWLEVTTTLDGGKKWWLVPGIAIDVASNYLLYASGHWVFGLSLTSYIIGGIIFIVWCLPKIMEMAKYMMERRAVEIAS